MQTKDLPLPIYFDYNATTPMHPEVLEAMLPYFCEKFGNPASLNHPYGWTAQIAVENSRKQIAQALGCHHKEIYFTSGATESNNLAILGTAFSFILKKDSKSPCHIITSNIEHKSVLDVVKLAHSPWGCEVSFVPADAYGQISLEAIQSAVKPHTKLITVMMANNEVGTINPIKEIGLWSQSQGIYFHTDCAQTFGKLNINVNDMGIDLLSLSGHKIYGPKGIGAIYVRSKNPTVELTPLWAGGSQERGLRPGTLNVPGAIGLGTATQLALSHMSQENLRLKSLQTRFIEGIFQKCGSDVIQLNGHPTQRLPNNVSFSLPGISADVFALNLSGLALSSGSACTSGSPYPSHVLKAMGHSDELAQNTLRFGLGHGTTEAHIDLAIEKVSQMIKKYL